MKTKRKLLPKSIPTAGDSTVDFSAAVDRISNVNSNVSTKKQCLCSSNSVFSVAVAVGPSGVNNIVPVDTNVVSYPPTSHSFPMSQNVDVNILVNTGTSQPGPTLEGCRTTSVVVDGDPPHFLQLYIYDTDNEVDNRLTHFGGDSNVLRRDIVEGLIDLLDTHTVLVQLFRTTREIFQHNHIPNFKVRLYNVVGRREYELPTGDMLGAIVYETGPDNDMDYDIMLETRSGIYDEINSGDNDASHCGSKLMLPQSFTGGPRYMYSHYLDALAICRVHGNPSYFITFTCNVNWQEITDYMLQFPLFTTTDRADVVDRVFEMKIHNFVNYLRDAKPFEKVVAVLYTLESQKRGLPHCHTLLWIDESVRVRRDEDIDNYVSVELPFRDIDPEGYRVVSELMMHGPCGLANPSALYIGNGKIGTPNDFDPDKTSWIDIPDEYCIPNDENRITNLIDFIYDDDTLHYPSAQKFQEKAIICPKNDMADVLNTKILSLLTTTTRTYLSYDDAILYGHDGREVELLYPKEYLNSLSFPEKWQQPAILTTRLQPKGTPIQANMDAKDTEYFDQLHELHAAYRITDYIGYVQGVIEIHTSGNVTSNQIHQRITDIQNLSGNIIRLTLWHEMAWNFNLKEYEAIQKPVVIAYSFKPSTVHLSQSLSHHHLLCSYPTIFNPLLHYQTNPLALLPFPHHHYTLAIPGYPIGYKETTPTMEGPDYIQPEDTKMEGFDHLLE
uniref:DNA helicase n=1 Tax=Tanacetum cinerariifolium TaxID=118510 RepID=A0A6L2K9T7_TANCI|nr:DNA helicase [Tanacetum cinerariifolium]